LAGSTSKKVVVYRYDREALTGYVSSPGWLLPEGVQLLSPAGTVAVIPYEEIKLVCFVRDFEGSKFTQERRLFTSRPKTEGLWVRAQFQDNDFLEGIMANNLLGLETYGFTLIPPDPATNNQRVFLPRASLRALAVMGVVGSPAHRRRAKADRERQIGLFE